MQLDSTRKQPVASTQQRLNRRHHFTVSKRTSPFFQWTSPVTKPVSLFQLLNCSLAAGWAHHPAWVKKKHCKTRNYTPTLCDLRHAMFSAYVDLHWWFKSLFYRCEIQGCYYLHQQNTNEGGQPPLLMKSHWWIQYATKDINIYCSPTEQNRTKSSKSQCQQTS